MAELTGESDTEAVESWFLLVLASRFLCYKSSACLLEKHLEKGEDGITVSGRHLPVILTLSFPAHSHQAFAKISQYCVLPHWTSTVKTSSMQALGFFQHIHGVYVL